MMRRRRGLRYYLLNYVPFAFEIDKWVKRKILEYYKRKIEKRSRKS